MKTFSLRTFIIVAALALCPRLLHAADSMQRDMLLASDGTLYTIESVAPDSLSKMDVQSSRALVLTVQNGNTFTTAPVPASLIEGYHFAPALAYDNVTNTLFIFWETMRNGGFTSDLSFCSYRDGSWGTAITLDSVDWDLRENLHIALTRKTEQPAENGETASIPELTVHAVWWQQSGTTEWARYAMLTTDGGNVTSIQVRDLSSFVTNPEPILGTPVQNELLRYPIVLESAGHDTVDVVFGDLTRNSLHRVTLKPVANGRLRVPIGVKDRPLPTPVSRVTSADGLSGISSSDGSLAIYFTGQKSVSYLVLKNGEWSALRSIELTDKVSLEAAIDALRRMMSSE